MRRLYLALFAGTVLLSTLVLSGAAYKNYVNDRAAIALKASQHLEFAAQRLTEIQQVHQNDLLFLSRVPELTDIALSNGGQGLHQARELVKNYLLTHPDCRFVHVVARNGMDILRARREGKNILFALDNELGDRVDRPYYTALVQGGHRHIVSCLDVHDDNGKPNADKTPNVRLGTALLDKNGDTIGIVLASYEAAPLLSSIRNAFANMPGHIRLINNDGFYLLDPDPEREWGFARPGKQDINLAVEQGPIWQRLQGAPQVQFYKDGGIYSALAVDISGLEPARRHLAAGEGADPGRPLRLVYHASRQDLLDSFDETLGIYLWVFGLTLFLSALGAYVVSGEMDKRQQALRHLANRNRSLLKAQMAKRDLFAHITSEMRSPLNGIIGFSDLTLVSDNLDPEQRDNLSIIRDAGKKLLGRINDVIDYARFDAEVQQLSLHSFGLRRLMEELADEFQESAISKGLVIQTHIDPELPPWLTGDARRLARLLGLLLDNALKYTAAGEVHLEVRQTKATQRSGDKLPLEFMVRDTGPGLSEVELKRAFTPGHRPLRPHGPDHGGIGLGLPLAKRLADLLRARLTISCQVGQGCQASLFIELGVSHTDPDAGMPYHDASIKRPDQA